MQIFTELNKNPNLSIALGFFDGVHLGHQAVIKSAVNFAKQNGKKSAVITFSNHPCCYLWNVKPQYIINDREKKLAQLGIDYLYELDFESLSELTAKEYLENILIKNFTPISISTGWNHNFGCQKSGDVKFLKENSKIYGYEFFELPPQKLNDEIISSTTIRKNLSEGNIKKANLMLGYNFSITGEVVTGNKIGRTIGFKTANIIYPTELIELAYGVYDVLITIDKDTFKAIANFGVRPTINGTFPILEVHILDFDKEIYGKNVTVNFKNFIRPERKFSSLNELKTQIRKDILSI